MKNTEVLKVLHTSLIIDLWIKDSIKILAEEIMAVSKIKIYLLQIILTNNQ